MSHRSRRLLTLGVVLGVGSGLCGLAITTAAPAPAQPPSVPVLNDGDWMGTLGASGPLDIDEFHGEVIYEGTFEFTVFQGTITEGTWQIGGSGVASHPRVTGTVSYLADGVMGGDAGLPEMLPEGLTAAYDLVVNGVPLSGTVDFGPEEVLSFAIPLINATCDVAVGNWDVPANMVYQRAGGTSSITGYWFASRLGGSELAGIDQASLDRGFGDLMRRANSIVDAVYRSGQVDSLALNALINEAEWFNQRLHLGRQCAGRPLLGWVNPLGSMILGLVDMALNNPERFDDAELLGLVAAAVRTNALGSRAPDNYLTRDVRARLAVELTGRAEQARQDGDCASAVVLSAAASALNDPVAMAAIQETMAEVCA